MEVLSWRKVVVDLPSDIGEYRLLFEGEYNKTSSYYSRNYVTIDNLELRTCSVEGKLFFFFYYFFNILVDFAIIYCYTDLLNF